MTKTKENKPLHTLVLGASLKESRASNKAIRLLSEQAGIVSAVGLHSGEVAGVKIQVGRPMLKDVHTITLYLSASKQAALYDYILSLKPQRIIFNPGSENVTLINLAKQQGIQTEVACSLILLHLGSYYEEG